VQPPTHIKPSINVEPEQCQCPEEDEDEPLPMANEKSDTVEQIINFENEIQNIVYVK